MYLKTVLNTRKTTIILFIFILSFFFLFEPAIAYWDKLSKQDQILLSTGEWATPITTIEQFHEIATTGSLPTKVYVLINDLNFSGYTDWYYNSTNHNALFRGKLYGNNKTISNLTIHNDTTYNFHGIFPRMSDASVFNLTLYKVNLTLGVTGLDGTTIRAGLITGNATAGTVTLKNITINDCGVRGTASSGAGGLIGRLSGTSTVVNMENIKATNLRVFNKAANAGGLVGNMNSAGATLNVQDVEIDGEVHSYVAASNTGGIIGRVNADAFVNINRALLNITSQNTLETDPTYYLRHSQRYLGGVIGQNLSASENVNVSDLFFTGSLLTFASNARRADIGTIVGRYSMGTEATLTRVYYSNVEFRSSTGGIKYSPDITPTGQMSTLVAEEAMPTEEQWNIFFTNFNLTNNYWAKDETGKPYLIR